MKMLTVTMVLSLLAGVAGAGTMEFWVQGDGTNFYTIVSLDPSDNGGLAIFTFNLNKTVPTITNVSPKNNALAGFIEFRSAKNTQPIEAGQDTAISKTGSTLIYGVGQKVCDFTSVGGGNWKGHPSPPEEVGITLGQDGWIKPAGASYDYACVIATGTYTGAGPTMVTGSNSWALFDNTTSNSCSVPTATNLGFVPEPTTIGLIVMGALALLRRKR